MYKRPRIATITIGHTSFDYGDSTAYFFQHMGHNVGTSYAARRGIIPVTGRIRKIILFGNTVGVASSNENWTMNFRHNDTTDYTIATVGSTSTSKTWTNNSLNIPVTQGDTFSIKTTTPAWATNPTSEIMVGSILIEFP